MIKQKHLIWIACINAFFCFLNIGSQVYSENAKNQHNKYTYSPSNFLFDIQQIKFHFIITSIIMDSLGFIVNIVILILLYKQPYRCIINKMNYSNYFLLPLKLVFSISAHVQNGTTFDSDNISIYCMSTSNSDESKSACNLLFSQKFFLVFQYIALFICGCSVISFKYYYNIFIKQQASPQSPITQELQVPFTNDITSMKKGSKCYSISYTTRSTTKKGSIHDLEMCNTNHLHQKSPVLQALKPQQKLNTTLSEQNYLSNLVLPVDFNNSQVIFQAQNFLYKTYPKNITETASESQKNENNQQQPNKIFGTSLSILDKKSKSNMQMEKHPENQEQKPQQKADQINNAQRGSIYSQRSSIGFSQSISNLNSYSHANSPQNQSAYSASQIGSSPKRFSLNLYKCCGEPSQSPIKIFCKSEQMQQSILLNQCSPNQRGNAQQGSVSEINEPNSYYECYSPTNNTFDKSHHNLSIKNDNQKNILGNSQILQLKKSESDQIYEASNESEASYQSSISGNSNSIDSQNMSNCSYENQDGLQVSPNKYFRTDKTKINPLELAPSTAIIGHNLSTAAAGQMVNALDSVLKQNQNHSQNPITNFMSRVFQSIVK